MHDQNETISIDASPVEEIICAEDMENIRKLREMVKDDLTPFYDTNFNLLRWLRGFDNNFEEIVPKLRNHLAMRRSCLQLDNLTENELHNHPMFVHSDAILTSEAELTPDCLVSVTRSGQIDMAGVMKTFPFNEGIRAKIYNIERMLRAVMQKEKQTGRQHWIMCFNDLEGFRFDWKMLSMAKRSIETEFVQDHYVELFHSMTFVNIPNFFYALWAILKPFFPEKALRKVHIFGHSGWHGAVLKMARPEALPSYWNIENEENRFLAQVKDYLPVDPQNYYVPKADDDQEYTTLILKPGKKEVVEFSTKMGRTLQWEFETDGHFAFGVYFYPATDSANENKRQMAYPLFNYIGPTLVPIADSMPCKCPGEFHFVFSNEHAWVHSLKIKYRIWTE